MKNGSVSARRDQQRPVYSLFARLLAAHVSDGIAVPILAAQSNDLDCDRLFAAANTPTLEGIVRSAHALQRTLHVGTSAVGTFMAYAAPDAIEADQCGSGTIEAIGWLLAELADLAAVCHHLEVSANRMVRDRNL